MLVRPQSKVSASFCIMISLHMFHSTSLKITAAGQGGLFGLDSVASQPFSAQAADLHSLWAADVHRNKFRELG